ncbi:MAG: alpha-galactosidase [Mucilaginibacter polytrichastri]|nr:alpha-galactosidase [Mucilaginibacter polytrichastri]
MHFGRNGRVVYDLRQKTYSVFSGSRLIIRDAFFTGKNLTRAFSAADLTLKKTTETGIHDQYGHGKHLRLTFSGKDLPDVAQDFFVYREREFFFTRIVLSGDAVSTNALSPLKTSYASIGKGDDIRALSVPFDNDAFVRYASRDMHNAAQLNSAEVSAFFDNTSRRGLIIGSAEHRNWKTGIKMEGEKGTLSSLDVLAGFSDRKITRDSLPHGVLSGRQVSSPKIFVGIFDDWRTGLEAFGEANRREEPPVIFKWTKPAPFGWNSWGVIKEKLNIEKALKVTDFFADSLKAFRNGETAFIDLDSFWDNITGGMQGDYARLRIFVDACKKRGLEPGAYWAPFTDWGYKGDPNRRAEGSDYRFSEMWTRTGSGFHDFDGARALDPTHPGTQKRIDFIIGKLKECGFKMIKIDFLGHAAAESSGFYDKNIHTGMQAYRAGMLHLVKAFDGQMLVYAAISPSLATAPYAHMRRIACDAWKTMKDTEYTLNGTTFGWWQNRMYPFLDADHVVFSDAGEGENRARLLSALVTGTLITGDDFSTQGRWSIQAKKLLQDTMLLNIAREGKAFRPVEGNTGENSSPYFVRKSGRKLLLAVFNFGGEEQTFSIPASRIGLRKGTYRMRSLYTKKEGETGSAFRITLGAKDAELVEIDARKP